MFDAQVLSQAGGAAYQLFQRAHKNIAAKIAVDDAESLEVVRAIDEGFASQYLRKLERNLEIITGVEMSMLEGDERSIFGEAIRLKTLLTALQHSSISAGEFVLGSTSRQRMDPGARCFLAVLDAQFGVFSAWISSYLRVSFEVPSVQE